MTRPLTLIAVVVVLAGCSSSSSTPAATDQQTKPAASTVPITSKSPEAIALFRKGEMLVNNSRVTEAADQFAQALKLDPDFVLAHAGHGQATAGPEGLKELEAAAAAAANLPEAERLYVEGLLAMRRNENAAARTAFARMSELAPADWRGYYGQGVAALNEQKYTDAVQPLKKAAEIDPQAAAGAQNMLGYTALRQDDTAQAIAALQEYVRALPQEPNPQDSLGEALMAAGRFKESEAAFQKALELSPQFWNAHEGMAYARFYAGDWSGGREALMKARDAATRPSDKVGVMQEMAAAAVAQRKIPEALTLLDEAQKAADTPTTAALVPVNRGYTLLTAQRYKDAIAAANDAVKAADGGTLPPGFSRNLRIQALRVRVSAEALSGDANAAQASSATLDAEAMAHADDPVAQSSMHFGRAMLAVAQKDLAAAKSHFDQCSREDEFCRWQSVAAAEKAGDKASATAVREAILKTYKRDPLHLVIRSRLAPSKAAS
jgi:tetratricopeptide (TPR) repeat protein